MAQDSRRLASQGDTPGIDYQHYRNSSIADSVDHTTDQPEHQRPGSQCGRMVSIPSAFSDGTYGSISIHHTVSRDFPMEPPGTHLWQACKPPAVFCSERGIASVAPGVDMDIVRDGLAYRKR